MKLTDVAAIGAGSKRSRIAYRTNAAPSGIQPPDAEKDAIKNAIKAATIYAAIVVHIADAEDPSESLAALADFIADLALPDSFSGYAIVQGAAALPASKGGTNALILAKALGSIPATSIRLPADKSDAEGVAFYDDSVAIKTDFVARIDELCNDAVCIAAVGGKGGGVVPLWIPMVFVPRR